MKKERKRKREAALICDGTTLVVVMGRSFISFILLSILSAEGKAPSVHSSCLWAKLK